MPTYQWVKFLAKYELSHFLKEGEVRTVEVEGKKLCIGRNTNGYFAIRDRCPHAGASLGGGWCDEQGNVVCPVHRIKFDPKNGRTVTGEGYYAQPFPVEEREDGLYVGFEVKEAWWKFW